MFTKIYIIIGAVFAVIMAIVANIFFLIKNERIKMELIKETQFQQITIDNLSQNAQKQKLIIEQYEQLLKTKQQDLNALNTQERTAEKELLDVKNILDKQKMLNVLFESL